MKLGIVLILLSTAVFVALMVVPDATTPLAPLFCHSGEHLTNKQTTFSLPGETDTVDTFICEDAQGNARDITNNVMSASIIGFLVFLLTGVGMTIFGGARGEAKKQTGVNKYVLPTLDPDAPPARNHHKDRAAEFEPSAFRLNGQMNKHNLAETLRQLDDAHNQGLINDEEYQTRRQEALDKLVE